MRAEALLLMAVAVTGCSKQVAPTSYHDCVLSHTANTTASPDAVAAGKDFQNLANEEKGIVRARYFESVIRPYIHSDMVEDARRMFEVEAKLSASSAMTPR